MPQTLSLDQVPLVLSQFLITYLTCAAGNSILGSDSLSEAFNCCQSFGAFDTLKSYTLLVEKKERVLQYMYFFSKFMDSERAFSAEWVEFSSQALFFFSSQVNTCCYWGVLCTLLPFQINGRPVENHYLTALHHANLFTC